MSFEQWKKRKPKTGEVVWKKIKNICYLLFPPPPLPLPKPPPSPLDLNTTFELTDEYTSEEGHLQYSYASVF